MTEFDKATSETKSNGTSQCSTNSMMQSLGDCVRRTGDGAVEFLADHMARLGRNVSSAGERVGLFPTAARSLGDTVERRADDLKDKGFDGLCEDLRASIRNRPLTAVAMTAVVMMMLPRISRR